ncbi:hypothetical protein FACS1894107_07920 [Planctomycetales bacterium]|nr:hypothetical protein FACS1894107_07920 [Planctomycetales bacterium]GHT00787.1 hypothetical protein FACS1894108_13690 [Planctomycetales bacterium]
MRYGLTAAEICQLQAVFAAHGEVEKVVLFGSRAKGNFQKYSDIDLTLFGDGLNLTVKGKIEDEIDDLLLPYKLDANLWAHLDNPALRDHIRRVGKILFERNAG